MATIEQLKVCLSISSDKSKLPAEVEAAADKGNKYGMVTALQTHVDKLKSSKKAAVTQYNNKVKEHTQQGVSGTVAHGYINREDDPTNELNQFEPKNLKDLLKNIVMRVGTITAALQHKLLSDAGVTADEKGMLSHFNTSFNRDFGKTAEKLFKVKTGLSFLDRYKDMMQYLPVRVKGSYTEIVPTTYIDKKAEDGILRREDGSIVTSKLDSAIKAAMASTVYEWLATDGRKALGQDEGTLRQFLGLEKGAPIPQAATVLMDVGIKADFLAENLGQVILQRMGIKPTSEADALAKARLEKSLGLFAIAVMEDMGILKRSELFTGYLSDAAKNDPKNYPAEGTFGLAGLKDNISLDPNEIFFDDEGGTKTKEGTPVIQILNIVSKDYLDDIEKRVRTAPHAFEKLFDNEQVTRTTSWTKPKLEKEMRIGRSGEVASASQRRNLQKNTDAPYNARSSTMGVFKAMFDLLTNEEGDPSQVFMDSILGKESVDDKLHIHKKNVEGSNRGIQRDLDSAMAFMNDVQEREDNGQSTDFYIPASFMENMRMLMIGSINPQNSKLHRNLFALKSWTVSFKPSPKGKSKMDLSFKDAIAFAFDIESGKIGGRKKQHEALDIKLQDPAVISALDAISEFHKPGTKMTPELMERIAAGVAVTKSKVHGLKGLIEYSRYRDHIASGSREAFSTDIYKEIDGVSNGPIIGMMQLIMNFADKQAVLATLAMGGISVNPKETNLDENLAKKKLHDSYQRVGYLAAIEIAKIKQTLEGSKKDTDQKLYTQATAIGIILGSFTAKDGTINKVVRNLSKPRTMLTSYGAGTASQNRALSGTDVIDIGIYGKMESILNDIKYNPKDKSSEVISGELLLLLSSVNDLVNSNFTLDDFTTDGAWDIEKLRLFKLNPKQQAIIGSAVASTYGVAFNTAATKVFASVIEARKPFNNAAQSAATVYNTILKTKVEGVIAAKPDSDQITKGELDEILESIKHLIPRIKTPMGNSLPLAKVAKSSRDRRYIKSAVVEQRYEGGKPQQTGIATDIPYLGKVGSSAMVKAVQMLDSMVANYLMSVQGMDILNNHDGFSHAIDKSDVVGVEANTRFLELMEYNLGQAFADMNSNNIDATDSALFDAGVNPTDMIAALITDGVIDIGMVSKLITVSPTDITDAVAVILEKSNKLSYFEAVAQVIKEKVDTHIEFATTPEDFLERVLGAVTDNTTRMANEVTANKQVITDHVTEMAQYSNNGKGIVVTPKDSDDVLFDEVDRRDVLKTDQSNSDEHITEMVDLIARGYGSAQEGQVSTDENDYPDSSRVDSQNVREVFDSIVQLDEDAKHASVQNSPEHVSYLAEIMESIVAKVMLPIDLYRGEHKNDTRETMGLWQKDGKRMWIQTQQLSTHPKPGMLGQGIRMSAAEVYAHEMIHHVTHAGLKKSHFLSRQASDLYELAYEGFVQRYGDNAFRVFMNNPYADLNDPANVFEVNAAKDRWNHVFESPRMVDGSNAGVDEFLAMGMTNENFKNELSTLEIPDKTLKARKSLRGLFEQSLQKTIVNLFNRIMDMLHQTFYKQQHSSQADIELENLVRAITDVDGRTKSAVYRALVFAEDKATALAVGIDEKIKYGASATADKFFPTAAAQSKLTELEAIKKDMKAQGLEPNQFPDETKQKIQQLNTEIDDLLNKESNIAARLGGILVSAKRIPEWDNMISHRMRLVLNWYNNSEEGLVSSIVTEMSGTTNRLKPLHNLLSRRKRVIDAAANEASANMRAAVNKYFKRDLTSDEKVAITKAGLKTDISSLQGKFTQRAIVGFLKDSSLREAQILDLMAQIDKDPVLKSFRNFFLNAADDLGYYMITSDARPGGIPMMNAYNIAKMSLTKDADKLVGADFYKAVDLVDQLATLTSLRYANINQKNVVADLITEDHGAMENVLNHHNMLKTQALENTFNGRPALMGKGYTKQILNSRIQYEQGTLADKERYESMGFIMQDTPITRDPSDPVQTPIYMFKSTLGTINDMQSGIASLQGNTAKGKEAYALQKQIGNTYNPSAEADANNKEMLRVTVARLGNMNQPRTGPMVRKGSEQYMIPKFDINGDIVSLRYMMSEQTKDTVLQQHSEFDAILGAMSSQVVNKEFTPVINSELVRALKDMYDAEFSDFPGNYVEISPYSSNQRFRDIYQMLPPKTKDEIESTWGGHKMMVSRDVVDLAFGQRKSSIVEMFGKDKATRNTFESLMTEVLTFALGFNNPFVDPPIDDSDAKRQGRAVTRAKRIEDTMTQLTKLGKSNIIVRNLSVTRGNYASNIAILKSKGITLEKISTLSREAIISSLQYQADKASLDQIKLERGVTALKTSINTKQKEFLLKNFDRKIKTLENRIANNPSTAMIAAGLMPAIVDDIDTGHTQSPYTFGVDAGLDRVLKRLGKAEGFTRTLFMTEDTEGYRMLNNAVKMTDYVGRYVLYKHYTDKGMAHSDAVSAVQDEFINFDLPTHKTLEYLNNIGLVWFSKYQLRVLKHIKNLLTENPFSTIATFLIGSFIGNNNILNSVPGITKDVLQVIGEPMTAVLSSVDQILYVDMADTPLDW